MGKRQRDEWRMAALAGTMGFEIFAFIIVGALGGKYLDGRWDTHFWLPVGAVAGFFFGLFSCYRAIKGFMKK